MAGGEEDQRRYPRNLEGVLQFALNHSDDPTNSSPSPFQEMNEEVYPPFGLLDHCTVLARPKERIPNQQTRKSILIRDKRDSSKARFSGYFSNIDWSCVTNHPSCEEKLKVFGNLVDIGITNIVPERSIRIYPEDCPWTLVRLKELIRKLQQAFYSNRHGLAYRFYRNAVNKERNYAKGNTMFPKSKILKRREWLREAIASIVEDTDVKRMLKYLQTLEKPHDTNNADDDLAEKEDAFEELSMIVENLDSANDFHKIGGFQVMIKCLSGEHSSLRWRAADIMAVCVQNNPYCQKAAMEINILPTLTSLLETDQLDQVRIKALYAISCLTRDFPEAEEAFLKEDGFSMLLRAMQAENEKIITKSAFMIRNMLVTNPTHKETFFKMGFTELLAGLLQHPQNSAQVHIINLFKNFVMDYPPAISECQRTEFDLERRLSSIIASCREDDPDAHEDMILDCKELLNICFNK